MSNALTYTLIAVGLVIIIALLLLIQRQIKQARKGAAALELKRQQHAEEAQKQRNYLIESARLIANAILTDDKITLTEGCIRLKVMLDNLNPQLHQHSEYSVFEEVYNRTAHIPILGDWRALERKHQRAFEKEMREVEAELAERINRAARALLEDGILRAH